MDGLYILSCFVVHHLRVALGSLMYQAGVIMIFDVATAIITLLILLFLWLQVEQAVVSHFQLVAIVIEGMSLYI